jgi:hypothetical protein
VKYVPLEGEEKKDGFLYYEEAKDDIQRGRWLKRPRLIPENLLPSIKASFNFY